jgi:hypothetical protein
MRTALLGSYAASCGNPSMVLFFFLFLTLEDGTDLLSQNISKELPHVA